MAKLLTFTLNFGLFEKLSFFIRAYYNEKVTFSMDSECPSVS